jgi:hypothetical protein
LAAVLADLLTAAGVDVTHPMAIIYHLNTHCGGGATSASVQAVARSLDGWVQDVERQSVPPKTRSRALFLAAVVFYALVRATLWGHGVRPQQAQVPLAIQGVNYLLSSVQLAALTWYGKLGSLYPHANDESQYFDVPQIVRDKSAVNTALGRLAHMMQKWREHCDANVAASQLSDDAKAVVALILDALAVGSSHQHAQSQASKGPATRLLSHAAPVHDPASASWILFRGHLKTLAGIDKLSGGSCNLASRAQSAFTGTHNLWTATEASKTTGKSAKVDMCTTSMHHGRSFPVTLLFRDGMVLPKGLELLMIVVEDCFTHYYYRYWCTPVVFSLFDAGTTAYVPKAAKSSYNHQPNAPKPKLSVALRAQIESESGAFLRELRLLLQAAAFPEADAAAGRGPLRARYAERALPTWSD